jgi:gas vesicle protein
MKQHWLDIQSFLSDEKILSAIDDLAIALKLDLAGIRDTEREKMAGAARDKLASFLKRLETVTSESSADVVKGVDPRFKELVDAFRSARQDSGNFRSTLMQAGAEATIKLLNAGDVRGKKALIESLAELRRVVERHQQTDVSAIIEDF